jgi:hypothetical protein
MKTTDTKVYELAIKMTDLSHELYEAGKEYENMVFSDLGYDLLMSTREMVEDFLLDRKSGATE